MTVFASRLRLVVAVALGAALCLGAGACGTTDDSASDDSSATVSSYDVSNVQEDATIAALVPDAVKSDGKLTVGMDTSYAPAEFLDADGKTPVGFDVDIVKALSKVMGLEADPETASFDLIIPSVGSKYDLGVSSFTITKERMEAVDFVSLYNSGSTWVVQKGNPSNVDPSDICGLKVAVQTGTMQESAVNEMSQQCVADGKSKVDVLSSSLQTDVTTNVATGKADAFYADTPVAGYAIEQTSDTLQTIGEEEGTALEGIVVQKGDTAMAQATQQALQKLIDDGTYEAILKNWGVEAGAIKTAEINPTPAS
ncbi:ABC transporter substrate-binding protein [Bifidobacterium choloepi]|uniref:ABC transporter substrate-binding protein n=1 Tax=Bifidobacterium choloepi TaxID=2614131 RepID=A0A6I5N6Q2_9BIFI|nr:ABC transporter substrate-binding protein [Bifidobacterium choloepi]NEG69481.1 ABC transporter substrate-binding protein [Bifidobacterium choloepi]